MNNNALVVFSGGQDSTTCMFWAIKHFSEIQTVTFQYGQRHASEIKAAKSITSNLNIPHRVLDLGLLNQLSPSALTRDEIQITPQEGSTLPSTFVDGRNMVFLTFAAILAKQLGYHHIVTGVCETDFSGYPDCRDVFIKSLNVSLNLAMDYQFHIHTPLMRLNKAETWQFAHDLGCLDVIKNDTVTCYNGIIGVGCGECPACLLRNRGYHEWSGSITNV
jgi:7-cyano-7-deazaguanine synthase